MNVKNDKLRLLLMIIEELKDYPPIANLHNEVVYFSMDTIKNKYGITRWDLSKLLKELKTEKFINSFVLFDEEKNSSKYYGEMATTISDGFVRLNKNFLKLFNNLKNKINNKKNIKNIAPIETADGVKWEDIKIKFLNNFDVEVIIKNDSHKMDYSKMGFADGRKQINQEAKYISAWLFLQVMAIQDGKLDLKKLSLKQKSQYIKNKQKLVSKLHQKFPNIKGDVFEKMDKLDRDTIYRIKIKLDKCPAFIEDFRDKLRRTGEQKEYLPR